MDESDRPRLTAGFIPRDRARVMASRSVRGVERRGGSAGAAVFAPPPAAYGRDRPRTEGGECPLTGPLRGHWVLIAPRARDEAVDPAIQGPRRMWNPEEHRKVRRR